MAQSALGKGTEGEVGSSPLHHACREGHLQDVLDLLGRCDVEQVNALEGEDGPSPLDLASRHGHVDIIKALLKARARLNFALHEAVDGGQCAAIAVLVDAGGDIHSRRSNKFYQPIHSACEIGSVEVVETLLKHGAGLECTAGGTHSRPINLAARHGNNDVVAALLAAGTPVDYNPDTCCEFTPLQDAAFSGHPAVAKTLLDGGAKVNFASSGGWTALHDAAERNHADVVDLLMRAGADPNPHAGENDDTPLHCAVAEIARESAFALLKQGADVDAANGYGETSLHYAARTAGRKGSYDMLEVLLSFGANECAVDAHGYAPIAEYMAEESDNKIDFSVREAEDFLTLLRDSPADRRWRRRGLVILGRAFPWKLRMGGPAEGVAGAGRGSGTAPPPASQQAGAGAGGVTAVADRGRDEDAGGDETAVAAVGGLRAVMSSLLTMNEDDVFRTVVMFL